MAISSDLVLSTEKISLKEKQCADSDNMPLACIEIRIFLSYSANGNIPNIGKEPVEQRSKRHK